MSASLTEPVRHDGSKASGSFSLTDSPLAVEVRTSAPGAAVAAAHPGPATRMLGLMVVTTMNIGPTEDRRTISRCNRHPARGNRTHRREVSIRKPRLFVINWAVVDEADSLGWSLGPTPDGLKAQPPRWRPCRPEPSIVLAALDGPKLLRQLTLRSAGQHQPFRSGRDSREV